MVVGVNHNLTHIIVPSMTLSDHTWFARLNFIAEIVYYGCYVKSIVWTGGCRSVLEQLLI